MLNAAAVGTAKPWSPAYRIHFCGSGYGCNFVGVEKADDNGLFLIHSLYFCVVCFVCQALIIIFWASPLLALLLPALGFCGAAFFGGAYLTGGFVDGSPLAFTTGFAGAGATGFGITVLPQSFLWFRFFISIRRMLRRHRSRLLNHTTVILLSLFLHHCVNWIFSPPGWHWLQWCPSFRMVRRIGTHIILYPDLRHHLVFYIAGLWCCIYSIPSAASLFIEQFQFPEFGCCIGCITENDHLVADLGNHFKTVGEVISTVDHGHQERVSLYCIPGPWYPWANELSGLVRILASDGNPVNTGTRENFTPAEASSLYYQCKMYSPGKNPCYGFPFSHSNLVVLHCYQKHFCFFNPHIPSSKRFPFYRVEVGQLVFLRQSVPAKWFYDLQHICFINKEIIAYSSEIFTSIPQALFGIFFIHRRNQQYNCCPQQHPKCSQ